jgi:hypothetical protein
MIVIFHHFSMALGDLGPDWYSLDLERARSQADDVRRRAKDWEREVRHQLTLWSLGSLGK